MSWIGKLFGTTKAADDLLDKDKGLLVRAGGWVNDLSYTDAEKAENALLVKEWGIRQLEALAPFKVVQRILAFAASAFWIIVGLNVVAAIWIKAVTESACKEVTDPCASIDAKTDLLAFAFSDFVFWPVMVVFALYFTGGLLPGRGRS